MTTSSQWKLVGLIAMNSFDTGAKYPMERNLLRSQKGVAAVEFSFVAIILILVVFGIIEFGSVIQAQAVVTNVAREGGSIASRDLLTSQDEDEKSNLLNLLEASSWPLNFESDPSKFKIFIARVQAGTAEDIDPSCAGTVQESGQLNGSEVAEPTQDNKCGLTEEFWNLLTYDEDFGAPLNQTTVVTVYYQHDPLTPLANFLTTGGDGTMVISSKAVF